MSPSAVRVYTGLVAGFLLCLTLTDRLLPAMGLADLAHALAHPLDAIARYAIFVTVLWIVWRLWQVDRPIGGFAALAGALLQITFFEVYVLPLALAGLTLLGVAVWLGARHQRPGAEPAARDSISPTTRRPL